MLDKRRAVPRELSRQEASLASRQEGTFLTCRVSLGTGPAGKHKSNLVDEVCNVVDHVEQGLADRSHQVAKQVAKRVDAPADSDNQSHVVEGSGNSLTAANNSATGFTSEDFLEDEGPATQ